ncbi:MAG: flagellar filament capping protein FliD [Spirochaetales bacterium]|nr:flagellar filament capping protein FliD [Spirochaetales bacterium]
MSDFSIPGVNDPYGTQKIISGLMKVKNFKLTEMEKSKKSFEEDKSIWQDLNRHMKTVSDAAQALYGFNTPFGAKLGKSSDEDILSVAATRRAVDGDYQVKVEQLASGDRFLSKSLPLDFRVPQGNYTFTDGKKSIDVPFHGTKLSEFVDLLNSKADGKIRAVLVRDTEHSQVMQIETVGVGVKNKLGFDANAQKLMTSLGVIEPDTSQDVTLATNVQLPPLGQQSWNIPSKVPADGVLKIQYQVEDIPSTPPPTQASGFTLPPSGSVQFQNLTIQNSPMQAPLPQEAPPPPPAVVVNLQVLSLQGNSSLPLSPLKDGNGEITLPVADFPAGQLTLTANNQNTGKIVKITSATIQDFASRGNWKPTNPVTQARDAIVDFEGIQVTRDSNSISDVVPGTTLTLNAKSNKKVNIHIGPDTKAIKNGVIDFLVNYNKLLTDLNVLTSMKSPDPANASVIQDANYYTDDEKKRAEKILGRYQGDFSLNSMKSMLQRTMMDPYGIPGKSAYVLLAQVGISTNANGESSSSHIDVTKLRGYLEINDAKFDAAVAQHPQSVRDLFGVATHGDFIVDSGAAYKVFQILKPYTQLGGFNDNKVASIDARIKDKDNQVREYKDYLSHYEQDLKVKYGNMAAMLDSMKKSSSDLDSLSRQGGQ